ncbi:MAG: InlB B-repeat-containing protein, partial [Allobaculum sp.]|nr:InlB B-repeat-containing protein [Allobaculum sp.]
MKRKILWLLLIISSVICVGFLFSACNNNSAKIEQVEGATIKDNQIFMFVSSEINEVSLSDKVKCSKGSTWKLYYDNLGQTEIPTKIATGSYGNLKNGYNEFYIVVNSKDGTITSTYELSIYRSYSIHISYYDGTTLLKSERAFTGVEYTIDYSPNLTGYTFNGWKTSYGESVTSFTPWEATQLYADKSSNTFTATIDVNGGDNLITNSITLNYGEEATIPVPTRAHFDFIGWFVGDIALTDNNGKTFTNWEVPVPQIITAHWEIQKFSVTLLKNENEAGIVSGSGTYNYGTRVNLNTNTNSGYNFLGWYDNNDVLISSNRSYSFIITCDLTLTAKWNYYTLTTTVNDSEAGTASYFSNLKVSTG